MAFRECSTNNAFSPATLDDSVIRKYQIEANIFFFMVNIVQVDRNVRGSQKTIERMFQNEVSQSHLYGLGTSSFGGRVASVTMIFEEPEKRNHLTSKPLKYVKDKGRGSRMNFGVRTPSNRRRPVARGEIML